jgi:hypothetical protein
MTVLLSEMPVATRRKPSSALAVAVAVLTFGLVDRQPVQALPGESSSELMRNWRAATHILPRPKAERKYTDGYPDLSSQGSGAGGSLAFSVFLNSDRISESETIDYRPEACEREPYRCSGRVIFQKSGNDLGHLLIAEVFGPEVLEDFMRSDALKTISEPGGASIQVSVFYAGQRFNYTTWVHSEPGRTRAISHFTVLQKNDAELRRRIKLAETCSRPEMGRDPLCNAP